PERNAAAAIHPILRVFISPPSCAARTLRKKTGGVKSNRVATGRVPTGATNRAGDGTKSRRPWTSDLRRWKRGRSGSELRTTNQSVGRCARGRRVEGRDRAASRRG